MFTGIIETCSEVLANIESNTANRLTVKNPFADVQIGESIAVNGTCLTVLPSTTQQLAFDISPETLKLTTLGDLQVGELVNLERAMMATSRFSGHYVSGHIDATATVLVVNVVGDFVEMTIGNFSVPADKYLLPKGSITLDGVSLTINTVSKGSICIMLVPHTLAVTTLSRKQVGQRINVEFDYLTRVVAHQLEFLEVTA